MNIQREIADQYQGLFNLMSKEHNLILTISEMDEIIIEAQKVVKLYSQTPVSVSVCDFIGCKNEATNVLIIRNEYYCDKHS